MATTTTLPPGPPAAATTGESAGPKPMGVGRATVIMMVTVLLSRILGQLRDSIIAFYFGQGPQTDAYQAAFTVPDLLFYLLQSGALSSTVIPIITEYRQNGKYRTADRLVNIVVTAIFFFIGILIAVMWTHARGLVLFMHPGFVHFPYKLGLAVQLTKILLPAQLFFFIGGLMMGVLYSRKQFLVPALGPVIYNAGIIFGGVALHHWLGVKGFVWGAMGGAFIGNFALQAYFVHRTGFRFRPSIAFLHPAAIKVWRMLLPIGLGVSLPNIDQLVNKAFASYLANGDMTALMNAYRLMLLPIGLFAQSMALAVYPTLSEQGGLRDYKSMRSTLNQSLRNILFLTIPSTALMIILANPVITVLFQHGMFTAADTVLTAGVLQLLSIGICAWSCQSLLTRGFYALQCSVVPVISGACVSVLFVAMNWAVIHKTHMGVQGLGMATTIAATIHVIALYVLLRSRLRGLQDWRLLRSAIRMLIATVAMVGTTLFVRKLCKPFTVFLIPKLYILLVLLLSIGLVLAVFWLVAQSFALYKQSQARPRRLRDTQSVASGVKKLVATTALCGSMLYVRALCHPSTSYVLPHLYEVIVLLFAGGLGVGAYLWVAHLLGMPELEFVMKRLQRKSAA